METKLQTNQNVEIKSEKEWRLRKLLNIIGLVIFGGLVLTIITNPPHSTNEIKEFLLFIVGSAFIYYVLVNLYFIGKLWRKVVYAILIIIGGMSIFIIFYLSTSPITH
ncbi:hypothetical protein HPB58_16855 [Priestia filamentosa]|uniref:hypothetical protein n=1 Tax=Priestia filamentosa TaxID=1402861 RepID=UPI001FB5054A|nr:hypothetical protein [Priestia filamentosa]UOE58987.1 hypothetical protein HPB58_16855 [Priestia filamentosa]